MNHITEYRVVADFEPLNLVRRVNQNLEEGWSVQGGVACLYVPGLNHNVLSESSRRAAGTTYWSQAMIRKSEKESK